MVDFWLGFPLTGGRFGADSSGKRSLRSCGLEVLRQYLAGRQEHAQDPIRAAITRAGFILSFAAKSNCETGSSMSTDAVSSEDDDSITADEDGSFLEAGNESESDNGDDVRFALDKERRTREARYEWRQEVDFDRC